MELTSKQRKYLKASAHHLKPVVQVGGGGVTDQVIGKCAEELERHELIKVKLSDSCPTPKKEAAALLSEKSRAALVQLIGRTVILFLQRKKKSAFKLPKAEA
jgi:RNA-binding protein